MNNKIYLIIKEIKDHFAQPPDRIIIGYAYDKQYAENWIILNRIDFVKYVIEEVSAV